MHFQYWQKAIICKITKQNNVKHIGLTTTDNYLN